MLVRAAKLPNCHDVNAVKAAWKRICESDCGLTSAEVLALAGVIVAELVSGTLVLPNAAIEEWCLPLVDGRFVDLTTDWPTVVDE